MERINLHNHTLYSDGGHTPEQIINEAINANIEILGISDHFYTTKIFYNINFETWLASKWKPYIKELEILKTKYSNKVKVFTGIEIDTCFFRLGCDLQFLDWQMLNNNLDYILLEYVGEAHKGGMGLNMLEKVKEVCEIPMILAHPDIDFLNCTLPIDKVFDILRQLNIALEIPAGFRNKWYWHKYSPSLLKNLKLSIGTDTHREISEVGNIDKTVSFLKQNDLINQILNLKGEGTE